MDVGPERLRAEVEDRLWPVVEAYHRTQDTAGLAVAVVREGEVVARGFGVRDVGTGEPVTPETLFHLASVSKPFVAAAIVSLAVGGDAGEPALDLDAPIIEWLPELTLADGRAGEVTARGLLSHTSGLPDVTDYGWHDPQLGDDALSAFARSLSGWRLQADPGSTYSYSNAGYELLGLLLSRLTGTTFEDAVRQQVLAPLAMSSSTFLRSEVPGHLAAAPHVGVPLTVPGSAYPYTRRHAPSSTLHSNLVELCRWMTAHLEPGDSAALDPEVRELMGRPAIAVGRPPWEEAAGLGWALGSYAGHPTRGHSGADPGFGSRLVVVPERRTGVVVLANSNTVHLSSLTSAALDVALADTPGEGLAAVRALVPPVAGPVAATSAGAGHDAAVAQLRRLTADAPAGLDLDDEGFVDAVWGAIELHRTDLAWPLLRVWTEARPESSPAWTMTGWAHQVDGEVEQARSRLRRAVDLDPENDEAAQLLAGLPPA